MGTGKAGGNDVFCWRCLCLVDVDAVSEGSGADGTIFILAGNLNLNFFLKEIRIYRQN